MSPAEACCKEPKTLTVVGFRPKPRPRKFQSAQRRYVYGGKERLRASDASYPRLDRLNDERNGAHCSGRLPLVDLPGPSHHRRNRSVDVVWYSVRPGALSGDRGLLRGDVEAVSGDGQFLLFRGAVLSEPRHSV